MKHLHDYLFRFVRVKTTHGDVHEGTVILYFPTWNGNDEESIVLCKNDTKRRLFIFASDIVSIEKAYGSPNAEKPLRDYLHKRVRLTTTYGDVHEGEVIRFSPAEDGEDEEGIALCTNGTESWLFVFASEIVGIEEIDSGSHSVEHLQKYLFRFVRVRTIYGETHTGYVDTYTSSADNDETEESIGLLPSKNAREGIELFCSEIVSIEAIEGSPNPAKHLRDYLYEFVRVKTIYGNIHEGKVVKASPAKGKNEDSIGICTNAITGDGVSLFACEIVSIEKINGNPNPVEHFSDFLRDHSLISDVFVQVVRVKTIYGTVYEGEVVRVSPEKDSIGICTNAVTKDWVGLSACEIVSIEEI